MSQEIIAEDDLLPLQYFSSSEFTALELAKKRLLISQGEMSKLILDYERATSIELVSLVNDNYKAFLKVSTELGGISDRLRELKGQPSAEYLRAIKEVADLMQRAQKLKSEAQILHDTREDVHLLSQMLDICRCIDIALNQREKIEVEDLGILAWEFERVRALTEATEAVLAEGKRRGTALLRESLLILREEQGRIRTELILRLLLEADMCVNSSTNLGGMAAVWESLNRVQATGKLVSFLKEFFSNKIGEEVQSLSTLISKVRERFLDSSTLFYRAASVLNGQMDLWMDVLYPVVSERILKGHDVAVFVPTASNLDDFYANYKLLQEFLNELAERSGNPSSAREVHRGLTLKFKVSIYYSLRVAPLLESVCEANLEKAVGDLFSEQNLIDSSLTGKAVQCMVDMFCQVRDQISMLAKEDKLMAISLVKKNLTEKISLSIITSQEINRLIAIQENLNRILFDTIVSEFVSETITVPLQILESVKQVSALYRVTSRGFPSRPSAYVDLVIKPVSVVISFLDAEDAISLKIITEIAESIFDAFTRNSKEVLLREKQRPVSSTSATETEKISSQLFLDGSRIIESFPRGSETGEKRGELETLLKSLKHQPS